MKRIIKSTVCVLFITLLITGCNKDENFPTYEPPDWSVDINAGYYENMTAVVKIPDNLAKNTDENDKLAAFASDGKCRGVGVPINGLYFVSIKGVPEDQTSIHFMYYSARNKYLYQTDELCTFDANQSFGLVDEPQMLPLNIVK